MVFRSKYHSEVIFCAIWAACAIEAWTCLISPLKCLPHGNWAHTYCPRSWLSVFDRRNPCMSSGTCKVCPIMRSTFMNEGLSWTWGDIIITYALELLITTWKHHITALLWIIRQAKAKGMINVSTKANAQASPGGFADILHLLESLEFCLTSPLRFFVFQMHPPAQRGIQSRQEEIKLISLVPDSSQLVERANM